MSIAKSVCENYPFEDYALKLVQGSNFQGYDNRKKSTVSILDNLRIPEI